MTAEHNRLPTPSQQPLRSSVPSLVKPPISRTIRSAVPRPVHRHAKSIPSQFSVSNARSRKPTSTIPSAQSPGYTPISGRLPFSPNRHSSYSNKTTDSSWLPFSSGTNSIQQRQFVTHAPRTTPTPAPRLSTPTAGSPSKSKHAFSSSVSSSSVGLLSQLMQSTSIPPPSSQLRSSSLHSNPPPVTEPQKQKRRTYPPLPEETPRQFSSNGYHSTNVVSATAPIMLKIPATWAPVLASVLMLLISLVLYSMRDQANALTVLSIFWAFSSVVILAFLPAQSKTFDCELMLAIWGAWLSYGKIVNDSEWIIGGILGMFTTLVILTSVVLTYTRTLHRNTYILPWIILTLMFLLLFPPYRVIAMKLGAWETLAHAVAFILAYIGQEMLIIKANGGSRPVLSMQMRMHYVGVRAIQSAWTLFVDSRFLFIVVIQICYIAWRIWLCEQRQLHNLSDQVDLVDATDGTLPVFEGEPVRTEVVSPRDEEAYTGGMTVEEHARVNTSIPESPKEEQRIRTESPPVSSTTPVSSRLTYNPPEPPVTQTQPSTPSVPKQSKPPSPQPQKLKMPSQAPPRAPSFKAVSPAASAGKFRPVTRDSLPKTSANLLPSLPRQTTSKFRTVRSERSGLTESNSTLTHPPPPPPPPAKPTSTSLSSH